MSPRAQLVLIAVAALTLAAFVMSRLVRSRRTGLSIRMQIFLALATLLVLFSAGTALALWDVLRPLAATVAALGVALLAAAAASSALLGRALAEPIERLTEVAARIAGGERHAALPAPSGREVRRLTAAFESMRRELEDRRQIERLAADLSHQLKNPIAGIRAAAEVLTEGALEDPARARGFVARILEANARLEAIVNGLLPLTRLEAHGIEPSADEVDLSQLARTTAAAAHDHAARLGIVITVAAPEPVWLRGDSTWLRRAIENLAENALQHTPAGGEVVLRVTAQPAGARVDVENPGAGVAPEVRPRVFDRFATTRAQSGGTGLGLAIVRAVAEAHGGSAELADPGPPRTVFRISLPAAAPKRRVRP